MSFISSFPSHFAASLLSTSHPSIRTNTVWKLGLEDNATKKTTVSLSTASFIALSQQPAPQEEG